MHDMQYYIKLHAFKTKNSVVSLLSYNLTLLLILDINSYPETAPLDFLGDTWLYIIRTVLIFCEPKLFKQSLF